MIKATMWTRFWHWYEKWDTSCCRWSSEYPYVCEEERVRLCLYGGLWGNRYSDNQTAQRSFSWIILGLHPDACAQLYFTYPICFSWLIMASHLQCAEEEHPGIEEVTVERAHVCQLLAFIHKVWRKEKQEWAYHSLWPVPAVAQWCFEGKSSFISSQSYISIYSLVLCAQKGKMRARRHRHIDLTHWSIQQERQKRTAWQIVVMERLFI